MVGDSLRSDIAGSQAVGMHNCYIERQKKDPVPGLKPEFTIHSLDEIFKILGKLNEVSK